MGLTDMAVKVDHGDLSPVLVSRTEGRERGGVIATQGDDTWGPRVTLVGSLSTRNNLDFKHLD